MAAKKKYTVELHASEIELLGEALDSHAYWQLTEPHERRDGYTLSKSPKVRACVALAGKLLAATAPKEPACATCADTGRNAAGDDICTDCFLPEGTTSKHADRCDCRRCRPELYV